MSGASLLYAKTHEWVRIEGNEAVVGITNFAQEALGDITYVDLPSVGDSVEAGSEFGSVESVKAASDLISPVTGEVVAVNDTLNDAPEVVNQSPFTEGWMLRVKLMEQPQDLLDVTAYEKVCEEETH